MEEDWDGKIGNEQGVYRVDLEDSTTQVCKISQTTTADCMPLVLPCRKVPAWVLFRNVKWFRDTEVVQC